MRSRERESERAGKVGQGREKRARERGRGGKRAERLSNGELFVELKR